MAKIIQSFNEQGNISAINLKGTVIISKRHNVCYEYVLLWYVVCVP